ncbi:hypothetical protein SKAU_G00202960 [Synaphobranchus kaupii]|uniref:Uncharacterized protein n=1 Tax=Synaphobranchus kaupii TaxID=118154 RepID=A0A9Q1IWA2_SYNKA|nr:hypothetical protein SKAU_G00202960 [Synaphobranchus kaupii]
MKRTCYVYSPAPILHRPLRSGPESHYGCHVEQFQRTPLAPASLFPGESYRGDAVYQGSEKGRSLTGKTPAARLTSTFAARMWPNERYHSGSHWRRSPERETQSRVNGQKLTERS